MDDNLKKDFTQWIDTIAETIKAIGYLVGGLVGEIRNLRQRVEELERRDKTRV